MKKLFLNIVIFLCIVLPPLYFLDYAVNKGLRKTYFTQGCLNDVYNGKAGADILLCGASKTKFQYSPRILDSITHLISYNIGLSGWRFHMQYAIFQLYMQHNKKPKYIIQNIDAALLEYQEEFYEADQYMPYAHDTIVQKFTHHLKGAFTFAELNIPLFLYNNHYYYMKQGLKACFNTGAPAPPPTYKGYAPHREAWDGSFDEFKKDNPNGVRFNYNDTIYKEFVQFLDYCETNNIKVIFVYAPVYIEQTKMVNNAGEMNTLYNNLSQRYHIPIIDYTYDSISYQKKYFMNSQHLNIEGSEIFSTKLAGDLKPFLQP